MESVRTEGCHVGLSREFLGTACCTYGQSNATSDCENHGDHQNYINEIFNADAGGRCSRRANITSSIGLGGTLVPWTCLKMESTAPFPVTSWVGQYQCCTSLVDISMTSSNEYIFRFTGLLWGESTGHRWIPLTKASDAELWCFLWSAPEQTVKQTIETPVIWDAIAFIMTWL